MNLLFIVLLSLLLTVLLSLLLIVLKNLLLELNFVLLLIFCLLFTCLEFNERQRELFLYRFFLTMTILNSGLCVHVSMKYVLLFKCFYDLLRSDDKCGYISFIFPRSFFCLVVTLLPSTFLRSFFSIYLKFYLRQRRFHQKRCERLVWLCGLHWCIHEE